MNMKQRLSGIWLISMTLLSLFAYTVYFVAQMWLSILQASYLTLAVLQVINPDPVPVGPGKAEIQALKARLPGAVRFLLFRDSRLCLHFYGACFPVPRKAPGKHRHLVHAH